MDMVRHHTELRWVRLSIERWLVAPMQMPDGTLVERERGTPQGSPISPLLANLFMHYAFDTWMARQFPSCPFERYADDILVHCDTEQKARNVWAAIANRLRAFGLELHPDKTKIVYCKDTKRRRDYEHTSFDFLGYTFRGRRAKGRRGYFVSFSPAMSGKARKAVNKKIRDWHLVRRVGTDLSVTVLGEPGGRIPPGHSPEMPPEGRARPAAAGFFWPTLPGGTDSAPAAWRCPSHRPGLPRLVPDGARQTTSSRPRSGARRR